MVKGKIDIFDELSKKYNIHKSVVAVACRHPFIFASRRISDRDDEKSMMFAMLFKIRLKNRFNGKKQELHDEGERKRLFFKKGRGSI